MLWGEDDSFEKFENRYKDLSGKGLFDYLSKIEDTLAAEQNLIVAW